jgi:hypothetical protein
LREKILVLVVTADPEPCNRITLHNADGALAMRYPDCPDVFFMVDAFETQGWMKGVLFPQPIGAFLALRPMFFASAL